MELDLDTNGLSLGGALAVRQALAVCPRDLALRTLNLAENYFTSYAVAAVTTQRASDPSGCRTASQTRPQILCHSKAKR